MTENKTRRVRALPDRIVALEQRVAKLKELQQSKTDSGLRRLRMARAACTAYGLDDCAAKIHAKIRSLVPLSERAALAKSKLRQTDLTDGNGQETQAPV